MIIEHDGTTLVQEETAPPDEDEGRFGVMLTDVYEKHAVTREPCFGCEYCFRKPTNPGENKIMDDLWNTYERNRTTMSLPAQAKLLAEEFRRTYYEPAKAEGKPCMAWPEHIILRHIRDHVVDRAADIQNTIQMYSTIEKEMANSLFTQKDGETGYRANDKSILTFLAVGEKKLKLWALLKDAG